MVKLIKVTLFTTVRERGNGKAGVIFRMLAWERVVVVGAGWWSVPIGLWLERERIV